MESRFSVIFHLVRGERCASGREFSPSDAIGFVWQTRLLLGR